MKTILAGLCALFCVVGASLPHAVQAADPLFAMIISEDWTELDRLARLRLAADPLDGVALHALGRMAVDGDVGTEQQRTALLPQINACLDARPADALCRLAYGQVQGALLNSAGTFDALGSVTKVMEAFVTAVSEDPSSYDARESLVTFYIRAPGIVGGSMRRAYKQTDDYAKINADYAGLLYALIALEDKDLPKAEAQLVKLSANASDPILVHMVAKRWLAVGLAHLDAKHYDAAGAALAQAVEHGAPSVAGYAHWGLGRLAQAQGRPEAAIDEFGAFLALAPEASGKPADEARASLRQLGTN